MHVNLILHKMLSSVMHLKRLNALMIIVRATFDTKQLSITGLGRSLSLPIQERSGIRKVDRLVSNQKLHAQREAVYRKVARLLVGMKTRPWLIVDWSPVPNTTHHLLRAALVCEGRALSLYEEVHPQSKLANKKVHRLFLMRLKKILPEACCPILVTDAGYHTSWFKAVSTLGWDYVGRVRGLVKYSPEGQTQWYSLKTIHQKATSTAKRFGRVRLSKSATIEGVLCYYKAAMKGRVNKNKYGQPSKSTDSQDKAKSAKEPWVLITSLDGHHIAKRVVKIYQCRMQIEEGFRDLKSSKYGFGFEQARSSKIERIENLLLIAMLASFVAWIVGWFAEKEKLHYQFQANSIRHRRVLSLFYLGCRVIKKKIRINIKSISSITEQLIWAEKEIA